MTAWTRETTADPPHRELVAAGNPGIASLFTSGTGNAGSILNADGTFSQLPICPVSDNAAQQAHWDLMEHYARVDLGCALVIIGLLILNIILGAKR